LLHNFIFGLPDRPKFAIYPALNLPASVASNSCGVGTPSPPKSAMQIQQS